MELELAKPNTLNWEQLEVFQKNKIKNLFITAKEVFETYLKSYINDVINESLMANESINDTSQNDSEEYLTTKEACKLLKISPTTLWRWTEDGRITKHYVFGNPRFLKQEVLSKIKSITSKN